ncbi:MAG: hemolysin family protein [Tissierellia bacterium]|nr:hemolysin family protein [Tissierellia bacterium]
MDPDPGSSIITQIFILLLLTLINAFFSASEMAMIALEPNRLQEKADNGNKNAALILNLRREQSRFLSTIQVGITFAGFFSSAFAATSISQVLAVQLSKMGIAYADRIALVAITLILSYFTLVFGELVPKRVALQNSEKLAMSSVGIINLFSKLTKPFVSLLSASTNFILKLMGVQLEGVEEKVTLEDLKAIVSVGQEQGVINPVEKVMIDSIIVFDDKLAEEVMTARTEVFMIDAEDPIEDYIEELMRLQYSRIPVYEDNVDNIIGILYVKDLLRVTYDNGIRDLNIRELIRPAYFVPERKNINDLFMDLKASRNHIAILIDEYGGFSGIVTMEDLIEEIVGDIDDEYDHDDPDITQIDAKSYLVKGPVAIKDLNFRLGLRLDEETEDYDSVGGLMITELGYIPEAGDNASVEVDGIQFSIMEVEDNRIQRVRVDVPDTDLLDPVEE